MVVSLFFYHLRFINQEETIIMAKRKKKKLLSNRIMAIAGLFTAGSIVGAAVDFDSLLELNYTIPSLHTSDIEIKENISSEAVVETERDTIQVPVIQEAEGSDIPVTESVVQDTEKEQVDEPQMPEQAVTEPPVNEKESEPFYDEPESKPASSEDWRNDDWMEALFVPAEQPESPPTTSIDWMEKPEEPVQSGTVLPKASSMTPDLAGMLEGIAVFWTSSGEKIHLNPSCRSFEKNTVRYTGTIEEAQTVRTEWCRLCAEHLAGTDTSEFYIKGNIYSTKEILLNSYTYSDYCNGIPGN